MNLAKKSILFLCFFFALGSVAQTKEKNITLSYSNITLLEAVKKIEATGEYTFIYDASIIDLKQKVDLEIKNKSINQAISQMLANTNIEFEITNSQIALYPKTAALEQNSIKITGTIIDESGIPIIGATITVVGTKTGTASDVNGKFIIEAPSDGKLSISYIGYSRKIIPVSGKNVIQITLSEEAKSLSEVVVVGYGIQPKVNLTGAVASVNVEDKIRGRPVSNISSGLSGLLPGLDIRQSSGQPGKDDASINIRGIGTLNNASPLVLIDGMVGNMNDINPSDIESVSVLKDASSAAIYGSRAANGVILVTTKRGEKGRVKVSYNGIFSRQEATNLFDVISDYPTTARLTNEGYDNISPGSIPVIPLSTIQEWEDNRDNPILYPNTNWLETIFHPTWRKENNVSVSGGNDIILFNLGLGALNHEGIMEGTGDDRYSIKINLESRINNWLKVGLNSNLLFNTMQEPYETGYIMLNIAASSPSTLPIHPDGRYGGTMAQGEDYIGNNMLAFNRARSVLSKSNRYMNKLFIVFEPYKNLVFEGAYGINDNSLVTKTELHYLPMWNFQTESIIRSPFPENILNQQLYKDVLQTFYVTGQYSNTIKDAHNFKILAGFNTESFRSDYFMIGRGGMPDFDEFQISLSSTPPWGNGSAQEYSLVSAFARLNYDYKARYLFEFNCRTDGSSRFSSQNQWGTFPSVSLGWRISEENFMKENIPWVDNLKIRASIGNLGNNNIGNNYSFANVYSMGNAQSYVLGGKVVQGAAASSIPNKDLTWEKTTISNLGLDFSFLKSFDVVFDVYKRNTQGILITAPVPLVLGGLEAPYQNLANVENIGWEASLNYNKKINDKLSLGGNFNISHVSNKIKKYRGGEPIIGDNTIIGDGYEYGSYYGFICDGIFRTQSDIDNHAAQKYGNGLGDLIYRDIDDNGVVDDDDRTVIGKSTPDYVLGLSFWATYNRFDFSFLFQSLLGYEVWSLDIWNSPQVSRGRTYRTKWLDRWTPDNINAPLPRLTAEYTANSRTSDFWLNKADYLRLKNIQIGYTIPKFKLLNNLGVEYFRLFVSGENLFTITEYDGLDPETAQLSSQRYETEVRLANNHPNVKQFTFGINLRF